MQTHSAPNSNIPGDPTIASSRKASSHFAQEQLWADGSRSLHVVPPPDGIIQIQAVRPTDSKKIAASGRHNIPDHNHPCSHLAPTKWKVVNYAFPSTWNSAVASMLVTGVAVVIWPFIINDLICGGLRGGPCRGLSTSSASGQFQRWCKLVIHLRLDVILELTNVERVKYLLFVNEWWMQFELCKYSQISIDNCSSIQHGICHLETDLKGITCRLYEFSSNLF